MKLKGVALSDRQPQKAGDESQNPGEQIDHPADLSTEIDDQNY